MKTTCFIFTLCLASRLLAIHDIGISVLDAPVSGYLSSAENFTFSITNYGDETETGFMVFYRIDADIAFSELFTGSIDAGEEQLFTFSAVSDLSEPGCHTVYGWTELATDIDVFNDTLYTTICNGLDLGVSEIITPLDTVFPGDVIVQVEITNYGLTSATDFTVAYSLDAGPPLSEEFTGLINAGETAIYSFSAHLDLSALGLHTICAGSNIAGDADLSNNWICKGLLAAPFDLGITAIISPAIGSDSIEDVTVTIKNFADFSISDFTVYYQLTTSVSGILPVVAESYSGPILGTGDTYDFTFSVPADLSATGMYTICAWTNITADTDHSNDTACTEIEVLFAPLLGDDRAACGAEVLDAANPGSVYLWSTGETTQTIIATSGGTYWVMVTDAVTGEIIVADTAIISVEEPVIPSFSYEGIDSTIVFNNTSVNATSYIWYFGDGETSTEINPVHFYTVPDVPYIVVLVAKNSCGPDSISTEIDYLLNVYSPASGSGLKMYPNPAHDLLTIDFPLSENNIHGILQIFNAEGEMVFVKEISGSEILQTASLKPGIYIVKFLNQQKCYQGKLLID